MTAHRRSARSGQTTFEMLATIGLSIIALVVMTLYIQRAIAGGLKASVSSLGEQYNPYEPYSDNQHIASLSGSTHSVVTQASVEAPLLGPPSAIPPIWESASGMKTDGRELPSIPAGPVPREPAGVQTVNSSSWTMTSEGTYNASN
jgi:hypothetical protein